jgi:hypothetical protein
VVSVMLLLDCLGSAMRGKGCGVCDVAAGWGPVDLLLLLKARALWMVADEDLLRCPCCGESPVGAGCGGFVGGCGLWFVTLVWLLKPKVCCGGAADLCWR